MNEDDKKLNKENQLPVPTGANPSLRADSNKDDSEHSLPIRAEDADDTNSEDDDYNERLRDRDAEMQEQAESGIIEEEEQSFAIQEDEASYDRNQERGFDPLTHQHDTKEEIHHTEAEHESDVEQESLGGKKHTQKKQRISFLQSLKLKNIANAFKKAFGISARKGNRTRGSQRSESVSTYRHYTMSTPGNQAGIFDNTIEDNRQSIKETIIGAAAARQALTSGFNASEQVQQSLETSVKQSLGRGLDEVLQKAQDAAAQTTGRAATPYMDNLEHAKAALDVACEIKNTIKGSNDFLEQGAKRENLGTLDHDAIRGLGMNIAGKGADKGPSK